MLKLALYLWGYVSSQLKRNRFVAPLPFSCRRPEGSGLGNMKCSRWSNLTSIATFARWRICLYEYFAYH